jgi:hypothetical protein
MFCLVIYAAHFSYSQSDSYGIKIRNFGRVNSNYYRGAQPKGLQQNVKLFLLLIMALIIPGNGQSIPSPQQTEDNVLKFSVQSQLVEVYLTVTKGKELVPNLKASDFILAEDGMPVVVDRLDSQDVPLQIVLLVDISESVRPALNTIQDAAIAFVSSLNPPDRVTLILFNSEIHSFQQTTDDRKSIIHEIRNARAERHDEAIRFNADGNELPGRENRAQSDLVYDGQDTTRTSSGTRNHERGKAFGYPIA